MVSHRVAESPARASRPPAMAPPRKRRNLTNGLEYPEAPVFQDDVFPPAALPSTPQTAIEKTGGISPPDDVSRQIRPLPGVRQIWQRPLKPRPAQYAPPVFSRGANQTQQTSGTEPRRIQRQQAAPDGEPAQSAGERWDGSSVIRCEEPAQLEFSEAVQFPFLERQAGGGNYDPAHLQSGEPGPANQADVYCEDFSAAKERVHWPELPIPVGTPPARYNESRRDSLPPVRFSQETAGRSQGKRETAFPDVFRFAGESVDWSGSADLDWPDLPEEAPGDDDADLRAARELEHRSQLDREQSGMTWSEQPF
jgi:hypothetical protein